MELKGNARLKGESFSKYKKRRAAENKKVEGHLAGRLMFVSKEPVYHPELKINVVPRGTGRTYHRGVMQ